MSSGKSIGRLRAEIQIHWDSLIWATGFMEEVPRVRGQYRVRLARQQGDYHPAERLELVLTVFDHPLDRGEREELERLRAIVAERTE